MENNVIVRLENVSKSFGSTTVITNMTLDIYEGEFITFLGSSGCGKTTVLRMISGLEEVTKGKVFIDNVDVTNVDPTKREVNTIFQNFALFPKMIVKENITFGLRMKKLPKDEIEKKFLNIIKLVKLEGFEDRYPHELSGGQQQRVAIARGVIMNPKVLLLDESLCSLDLKLKKSMQVELKRIQQKLGITFIYVTHAQDEALSMSDRIAIMNHGVIEQLGTPQEVYLHPKTVFVADFIGEANILDAEVINQKEDTLTLSFMNDKILTIKTTKEFNKNDSVKIVIRPEDIFPHMKEVKDSIHGKIIDSTYSGDNTKLYINIDDQYTLKSTISDVNDFKDGQDVYITFDKEDIEVLKK
jgi:spermidine/putrescine transport system ATP-binding protein